MKILVLTPLFPPDTAPLAEYVKTLAKELAPTNDLTILHYGTLPEAVPGVKFISIEKRSFAPLRIIRFTRTLMKIRTHFDVIYAQNGPSVEIALLFLSFFTRQRYFLRIGDEAALSSSNASRFRRICLQYVVEKADTVIVSEHIASDLFDAIDPTYIDNPETKPEILSYEPYPTHAMETYTRSWQQHIEALLVLFEHAETQ